MVVGGWISGGWTDSTETLVEGGSAWSLHSGSLPDGGFGDCGIINYNNVLYLFGGEDWVQGRGYADRNTVHHSDRVHWRSEMKLLTPALLCHKDTS